MANSLDATALVSIAKNRNRLLKLADGIRTRKKPSNNKKSMRLDPAYTNIEHLVFGTYRPRAATPDGNSSCNNSGDHQSLTPTKNGFVRRTAYRSSDGSESERSSTVSSTDARCECNRHSPHLEAEVATKSSALTDKYESESNPEVLIARGTPSSEGDASRFDGGRVTKSLSAGESATKGDGSYRVHVAPTSLFVGSSRQPVEEVTMPTSVEPHRRGHYQKGNESRVQNSARFRKAVSMDESESSRRTSWKELAQSKSLPPSSDSRLSVKSKRNVEVNHALDNHPRGNNLQDACKRLDETLTGKTQSDRQNGIPSGIPKAKSLSSRNSSDFTHSVSTPSTPTCTDETAALKTPPMDNGRHAKSVNQRQATPYFRKTVSMPERTKNRHTGVVGAKSNNSSFRSSEEENNSEEGTTPEHASNTPNTCRGSGGKASGVTCKIRITPPPIDNGHSGQNNKSSPTGSNARNTVSVRSQSLSRNSGRNKTQQAKNNASKSNLSEPKSNLNGSRNNLNKHSGNIPKTNPGKTTAGNDSENFRSGRPKNIIENGMRKTNRNERRGQSPHNNAFSAPDCAKPKVHDFKDGIRRLERQTYSLSNAGTPVNGHSPKGRNLSRWSDVGKRAEVVDTNPCYVPEPTSLPVVVSNKNGSPQTPKTTWAQLGKSRSIESSSVKEDESHPGSRRNSLPSQRTDVPAGLENKKIEVSQFNSIMGNGQARFTKFCDKNQGENGLFQQQSFTAIPVPAKSLFSGPSDMALMLTCDDEPGSDIMTDTTIKAELHNTTNDLTRESQDQDGSSSEPTSLPIPYVRKRSQSVGSPSRHLDLRLLAAFQRYGEITKELPENPEGCMSDIEEKDENSSSGVSRETSEEPPDFMASLGLRALLNGSLDRLHSGPKGRSPVRRKNSGGLGLERLLPVGPTVVSGSAGPTVVLDSSPTDSPRSNVSVIACNLENSKPAVPPRRRIYSESEIILKKMEPAEPRAWEKLVTIETGSTKSHLVVGTEEVTDQGPTEPQVTPVSSLPPSSYRLIRNRPISRSERHLKTTSTPEIGSIEQINGGGSVRDVRRPWSEVYGEEMLLSQTSNNNCFSVPNFPRFGDGEGGSSFFNRFSTVRATDSMLQKFRKTFSLRFQKSRKDSGGSASSSGSPSNRSAQASPASGLGSAFVANKSGDTSLSSVSLADSSSVVAEPLPVISGAGGGGTPLATDSSSVPPWTANVSPVHHQVGDQKEEGFFKLGLSVLRSSRERKKGHKKDSRSSKCNSADSGIQVEGTCPSSEGTTEPNSATDSPAVVRRRLVSESKKNYERPLSDYIDHTDLESVDEATTLSVGKSAVDVYRGLDRATSRESVFSPVRRTSSIDRQLSTPPPIKVRTERTARPKIRRQKARSRLRRSISQPVDLEKLGFVHKGLNHGFSDHEGSREPSTASSEEDFSSDNEFYHSLRSPIKKQAILREVYSDTVTFAEALWDHVTIDPEELPFKAGEVIEVTDTSDKDWWWGSIGHRSGWFPAPFVRLRVSQEDTVEDCMIRMADGTLTSRGYVPRKMSVSLLSNEQVRANIIREIVTTERDFVKHLKDVVEGYLRQVRRRPDMFSDEHISTIFGNIEAIYKFQSVFLKHLEGCINWHMPHISEIGLCFLQHNEHFKIYSEYCNNHPLAVSQLQELYGDQKYIHFFEACRLLQEMIDISLDGFLLTPVQKICKYPLQLAELLKYTKPDHPDYPTVTNALAAMRGVAQLVNERKRRMECLEKLVELQRTVEGWEGSNIVDTSSMLIHSGEATRVTSNWSRDISLFICDHLLIYCKKDLLKRNTAVYKGRIDLDHCSVFDVEDGRDAQFGMNLKNAWKIHCTRRDKWFLFYAKTPSEKSRWLQALREERQQVEDDRLQGFAVTIQAKKAAKLAVLNKSKSKRPRAKIPKGTRPHPDTAVVELLLDPPGPKTRSGSLPSNLSPSVVVNGNTRAMAPTKKKGSGWFHFGSGKKSKK